MTLSNLKLPLLEVTLIGFTYNLVRECFVLVIILLTILASLFGV